MTINIELNFLRGRLERFSMDVEPTTTIASIVEYCTYNYGLAPYSIMVVYQNQPIYIIGFRGQHRVIQETIESAKITHGALIHIRELMGPAG